MDVKLSRPFASTAAAVASPVPTAMGVPSDAAAATPAAPATPGALGGAGAAPGALGGAESAASAAPASPSPLGARSAHSSQAVPPSAGSAWDGGISTFPSAVSALSSSVAMGVSIARPALNLLAREISRGSPAAGGVFGNLIAHIGGSVATPPESSAAASRPAPQARAASPAPTDDAPARYFCDLCEVPIVRGLRWKCVVCPDWDACVSCFERITENETNASPLHDPTHPFLRILRRA